MISDYTIHLPGELVEKVEQLRSERSFAEIVQELLEDWVERRRTRIEEDEMIVRACASRSPDQIAEETEMARLGGASALRILAEEERRRDRGQ